MAYFGQPDRENSDLEIWQIWTHYVVHGRWSWAGILLGKAVTTSEKGFRALGIFAHSAS